MKLQMRYAMKYWRIISFVMVYSFPNSIEHIHACHHMCFDSQNYLDHLLRLYLKIARNHCIRSWNTSMALSLHEQTRNYFYLKPWKFHQFDIVVVLFGKSEVYSPLPSRLLSKRTTVMMSKSDWNTNIRAFTDWIVCPFCFIHRFKVVYMTKY